MKNVFSIRNYRLVFFGALVSELGALLYSFAVSFYILDVSGNNAFLQGLYLALCGAVMLVLTPIGGVLGDRFNKARIMFVCDYIKGGLILLATLLMLLFPEKGAHLAILFAVGIAGSAISGIFSPAAGSLLPHIVDEELLQQANSYNSIKNSLQSIFGVVLAGVLYAALDIRTLFLIVGLSYVASGISEMFIRYEAALPDEKLTVKVAVSDMGEGLRYLRAQKALLAMLGAILFINFFMSPVMSNFLPYFVKTDVAAAPSYLFDGYLTPELWMSAFEVLLGISSLAGAAVLSTRKAVDKVGFKIALRVCAMAAFMAAAALVYYLAVDRGGGLNFFLLFMCAGSLMLGVLLSFVNIPLNTAVMRIVDKDKLSKVSSIISVASQGLIPIASVLAGAILQYFGSTVLLAVCTAGFTAAALSLLFNKRVREI